MPATSGPTSAGRVVRRVRCSVGVHGERDDAFSRLRASVLTAGAINLGVLRASVLTAGAMWTYHVAVPRVHTHNVHTPSKSFVFNRVWQTLSRKALPLASQGKRPEQRFTPGNTARPLAAQTIGFVAALQHTRKP